MPLRKFSEDLFPDEGFRDSVFLFPISHSFSYVFEVRGGRGYRRRWKRTPVSTILYGERVSVLHSGVRPWFRSSWME